MGSAELEAILRDYRSAPLPAREVAMLAFAEKVIVAADRMTPEDIGGLRAHGFSDSEILDIAAAAAARSFFSKVLDALGAEPEERYLPEGSGLRKALEVGRPVARKDKGARSP